MSDDFQIIWYKNLNSIELTKNSLMADAMKSWTCIQVVTDGMPYLQEKISAILEEIKQKKATVRVTKEISPADEVRKYKGFLDDGIITEEEFLKKKEQLMDGDDALEQLEMDAEVVIDINSADKMPAGEGAVSDKAVE